MMRIHPDEIQEAQPMRWFCVATRPAQEHRAARELKAQGFEPFVPELVGKRVVGRTRRVFAERRTPLFRGYVFVLLAHPVERAHWNTINTTDCCQRLLATEAGPSPLPAGFVEALQAEGPLREVDTPAPHRFRKGHRARITAGPFAGLIGMVARAESDKRIHILLRMLGGERELPLPISVLEPVESPPEGRNGA